MAGEASRARNTLEGAEVLAGERGDPGRRAVRLDEIEGIIRKILVEEAKRIAAAAADDKEIIGTFHDSDVQAGFFPWQLAGSYNRPTTLYPPPVGLGGGAIFLERAPGVGTFIAAVAAGVANDPRLFAKTTGSDVDTWGIWREIFTEANVNGVVVWGDDGKPQGALWTEFASPSGGVALRCANGYQIAFKTDLKVSQVSGSRLATTWTYAANFTAVPFAAVMCPGSAGGTFTGVSVDDIGRTGASPTASLCTVELRRDGAAPAFAGGAEVEGVMAFAFGRWKP